MLQQKLNSIILFIIFYMTEQEVFKVVIKTLIRHFPHGEYHYALACYDRACQQDYDCWHCYFHRPQINEWEISRIIPELEDIFLKKCTLEKPDLYDIVKFFADT